MLIEGSAWVPGLSQDGSEAGSAVAGHRALVSDLGARRRAVYETRLWLTLLAASRTGPSRGEAADAEGKAAVDVIHGRRHGRDAFWSLVGGSRREIRAFDTPPYVDPHHENNEIEVDALRRGVRIRVLHDRRAIARPGRLPAIVDTAVIGEEIRVGDVPNKMWLSDNRVAMLPLWHDPVDLDNWLLVRDPVLLAALSALFELYWEQAVPLDLGLHYEQATTEDAPTPRERELLSLLLSGLTDQEIAEHCRIHPRTANRWLADLLTRLGAGTRFQAGYQAVRRGWLTPDAGAVPRNEVAP